MKNVKKTFIGGAVCQGIDLEGAVADHNVSLVVCVVLRCITQRVCWIFASSSITLAAFVTTTSVMWTTGSTSLISWPTLSPQSILEFIELTSVP